MKRILLPVVCWIAAVSAASAAEPIGPKVVVVAIFESGADTGDRPGEFQLWVERETLAQVLPFPQGYRDLRTDADGSVLGVVTGVGTAKSAATIMALGIDPRFDLSRSYWLVAVIAGIDPADGPLGAAVRAEWVVDGDPGHEIDAREMPAGWTTGYIPPRKKKPLRTARRSQRGRSLPPRPGLGRMGLPTHEGHAVGGYGNDAKTPDALHRLPQGPATAARAQGRHAFRHDLLARQAAQPVGQRPGEVFQRWHG